MRFVLLWFASLAFVLTACAQTAPTRLWYGVSYRVFERGTEARPVATGGVYDSDLGTPYLNYVVTFASEGAEPTAASPDSSGTFTVHLDPGRYDIRGSGLVTGSQTIREVRLHPGDSLVVRFDLYSTPRARGERGSGRKRP